MNSKRRYALRVVGALACAIACGAFAQENFPSKPIRIVVPVSAGGNLDIVARAIAERLQTLTGQPVVVENRVGASSILGTRFVAKSPPDGYTLLAMGNTLVSTPAIIPTAGYDPVTELVGVTLTARLPNVLVVAASSPYKNVQDLIAAARAKPGTFSFGSAGAGSISHLASERFVRQVGITATHVPYKGNAPALVDAVGGRLDFLFDQISTSAQFLRSGKLRALGVTALERAPLFPDIPTLDEGGVRAFEDVTFNGLVAPAGTPAAVLNKLHADLTRVLAAPELRERFGRQGVEIVSSPSWEQFNAWLASETARYAKLAREANIKVD